MSRWWRWDENRTEFKRRRRCLLARELYTLHHPYKIQAVLMFNQARMSKGMLCVCTQPRKVICLGCIGRTRAEWDTRWMGRCGSVFVCQSFYLLSAKLKFMAPRWMVDGFVSTLGPQTKSSRGGKRWLSRQEENTLCRLPEEPQTPLTCYYFVCKCFCVGSISFTHYGYHPLTPTFLLELGVRISVNIGGIRCYYVNYYPDLIVSICRNLCLCFCHWVD